MIPSPRRRLRDRAGGPVTLINTGCRITGAINGTGNYQLSGKIQGDCDLEGAITIHADGHFIGTIKARHILVAGHVDGDIVAEGHVEIAASARISGTITGGAIAVAAGAVVEGAMRTTNRAEAVAFSEKRVAPEANDSETHEQ